MKALLTVPEVAQILRVNPETVRVMVRRGDLQATRATKGRTAPYLFTDAQIARFLGVPVSELPHRAA